LGQGHLPFFFSKNRRLAREAGNAGGNAWVALRAANEKVGQFSENQIMVDLVGIVSQRLIVLWTKP